MKKKLIIIISIIVIGIAIAMLYQTFAVSSLISGTTDNTYDITLGGNTTVTVPAKSSKIVYYQVCNTNKGTVQYGVGYTSDNVVAKVYWNTTDLETGTIEYGENKFVKLKLINNSVADDTINLVTVLGYEFGGDLVPSSDVTLVNKEINEYNYIMLANTGVESTDNFLRSEIKREEISSVTFVETNIVPDGMTSVDVSMNQDGTVVMWYGEKNSDNLYDIYVGGENGRVSFISGNNFFRALTNVKKIKFSKYIDTSNVIDMASFFANCYALTEVDTYNIDVSNVEYMGYLFSSCESLANFDLSTWDTNNVRNMHYMFYNCENITNLDLSNFNTSNVEIMYNIFQSCYSLTELDVSSWNVSNVRNMSYMFYGCKVTKLDLSKWNTSNVTTMESMFGSCTNLISLDLSNFDTSKVSNMNSIFYNCSSITMLDISSFDTSGVTDMTRMFYGCKELKTIYVSNLWNTGSITNSTNMFYGCTSLEGSSGTTYNSSYIDKTYAKVDGGTSSPGYFTYKEV